MDFSSLPIYLDPPNWNQQPTNQVAIGGGAGEAQQLLTGPVAAAPPRLEESGMAAASTRPNSMAERARLAKIPQPEPALNCPRCDSTNTKFCYFNNYSLSQPRHFCKACRRYWTRGGSLRSVPVGGGCRRNKRSKGSNSSSNSSANSTTSSADHRQWTACSSSSLATSGSLLPSNIFQPSQFMASLHPLIDYGAAGMNFSRLQPIETVDYQAGSSSSGGLDQWRIQQIQQFPFLGGFDCQPAPAAAPVLFPFDAEVVGGSGRDEFNSQVLPKVSCSGLITQLASVKMEDRMQRLGQPRQYLGIPGNDQYWGGGVGGVDTGSGSSAGWAAGAATDLSSFNSSSSGNLL